jgi:hypothetical protein
LQIKVNAAGEAVALARHLSALHNVGKFWSVRCVLTPARCASAAAASPPLPRRRRRHRRRLTPAPRCPSSPPQAVPPARRARRRLPRPHGGPLRLRAGHAQGRGQVAPADAPPPLRARGGSAGRHAAAHRARRGGRRRQRAREGAQGHDRDLPARLRRHPDRR